MLYIIAGATASGKTAVAIALAHKIKGEIINADSMQIYRGMNIGTAKPDMAEREGIPHHLLDIVNPDEPFSVALYQKMAQEKIREIQGRGSVPILVGGTGFYINAVVYNTDFSPQNEDDTPLRNQYLHMATEKGASYIHDLLAARDPQAAREIHSSNIKRVARALAFVETTGALFSSHNAAQKEKKLLPLPSDIHFFILDMPREKLYERINRRTEIMLNAGLEEEVAGLLQKGYSPDLPAMQAIGYKEILAQTPKEILAQTIAQNTRHYAKRQLTWFRNSTPHARWINADDSAENIAEIMQRKI